MPDPAPPTPCLPGEIRVEVAYADATLSVLREVVVPQGATVAQAIDASRILDALPPGFDPVDVGIWGRIATRQASLRDGDRVELYRPLTIDPKDARRQRAGR